MLIIIECNVSAITSSGESLVLNAILVQTIGCTSGTPYKISENMYNKV